MTDPIQHGLLALMAIAFGVVMAAGGLALIMFH